MLMPWLGFPPGAMADGAEVWRRDAYGFAVRPQHVQRFREYAKIYKVINFARVEMFCSLFVSGKCSVPCLFMVKFIIIFFCMVVS